MLARMADTNSFLSLVCTRARPVYTDAGSLLVLVSHRRTWIAKLPSCCYRTVDIAVLPQRFSLSTSRRKVILMHTGGYFDLDNTRGG